jgi:hypothetical protein
MHRETPSVAHLAELRVDLTQAHINSTSSHMYSEAFMEQHAIVCRKEVRAQI